MLKKRLINDIGGGIFWNDKRSLPYCVYDMVLHTRGHRMIIKWNFDVFKKNVTFLFRIAVKRETLTQGYTNRCHDGQYVLFLDYDGTPLEWIQEEIKLLQERYDIGTAYTFVTKHGFHVVFLEKFTFGAIINMMDMTSCDKHYKDIPMFYGRRCWVLRHSDKKDESIKYLGALPSKHLRKLMERSLAHKIFIQKNYNIPEKDFAKSGYFDENKELTLAFYKIPRE